MTAPACDAFLAGGGPAGSAAAIALAQAGMNVVLAEKSRAAHDKVCGEFLSRESVPLLARLGVDPAALGAQTIRAVRLVAKRVIAEAALPTPALSLTRRTLDEALLARAQQAGATVLRGSNVESLTRSEDRGCWRAKLSGEESCVIESRHAFLATGKHDLRGWPREPAHAQTGLVAFKMYFALAPARQAELDGYVELLLYPGGYAGFELVEGNRANLCLLVTEDRVRRLEGRWDNLLDHIQCHSPHLAQRLTAATPLLERPLALSSIPYGYCVAESNQTPQPWRIGDQSAVIPSFCGDGIALALSTAHRAVELCLQGTSPDSFHAETHDRFQCRLRFATMLSRLMVSAPALAQAARLRPSLLGRIFEATRLPDAIPRLGSGTSGPQA